MSDQPLLSSEVIQMIVSSVTHQGHAALTELEAERLLNAIARAQSGVPTGVTATKALAEGRTQSSPNGDQLAQQR